MIELLLLIYLVCVLTVSVSILTIVLGESFKDKIKLEISNYGKTKAVLTMVLAFLIAILIAPVIVALSTIEAIKEAWSKRRQNKK